MALSQLREQWLALCAKIGVDGEAEWQSLSTAYTSSGLAYHNLDHIADCLLKFQARKTEAADPIAVELAIWFHDAIYDPRAADNEEKSAHLAANFLKKTPYCGLVPDLIIATKHIGEISSPDAALLCDIDLSILASPIPLYQKYSAAIREEYSWVPSSDYRRGRTKVLKNFLNREFIYALKASRIDDEPWARNNLAREIQELAAEK